jgi:cyclase
MICNRLIPSLLLKNGRLVKGIQYGGYLDAGSPVTTARTFNAQGADEILLVDIDATKNQNKPDFQIIKKVAIECFMPLTIGGGIRDVEVGKACMDSGADKLLITSAALHSPSLINQLASIYGSQSVVLGVDIVETTEGWRLYDHTLALPCKSIDWLDWVNTCVKNGVGEIRLMSVSREGTRKGMDLSLYKAMTNSVNVPIIFEGGCGSLEHLDQALKEGCTAIALGTMLVFSDNNLLKLRQYLANKGHQMRV